MLQDTIFHCNAHTPQCMRIDIYHQETRYDESLDLSSPEGGKLKFLGQCLLLVDNAIENHCQRI